MLRLADGKSAKFDIIANLLTAQMVNKWAGGLLVTPWEIDQLPYELLWAIGALANELPYVERGMNRIKTLRQSLIAKHPTFGKLKNPGGGKRH